MKIQSFCLVFYRATEMRNILLYCILPMIRKLLDCNRAAHLGLYVAGIRVSKILNSFKKLNKIYPFYFVTFSSTDSYITSKLKFASDREDCCMNFNELNANIQSYF
jgi:hypothetical protein